MISGISKAPAGVPELGILLRVGMGGFLEEWQPWGQ
jgi:hypothetical protein